MPHGYRNSSKTTKYFQYFVLRFPSAVYALEIAHTFTLNDRYNIIQNCILAYFIANPKPIILIFYTQPRSTSYIFS